MNRKRIRVLISFLLVLGLVLSTASMGYAAPRAKQIVTAEILSISGGQDGGIEIQYSWNNVTDANTTFNYKIEKERTTIKEYTTTVTIPSYNSEAEFLSVANLSYGTYKITAQLIKNGKIITRGTDTFRYEGPVVPTSYTVTFDETNALAGVGIQVYSDSGRTATVGALLTTDANGEATINLADGTYYYKATKTGYNDYNTDSFTVAGGALTENFTMVLATYTVTFDETNALAGVGIQVYSDSYLTAIVGSLLSTDSNGEATIELTDGTYYYEATKTGYNAYNTDSFTVAGGALTENFTMAPDAYTVTFEETNALAGVGIQVYIDSYLTTIVGSLLSTDSNGEATIELIDGTYYYEATKTGYNAYNTDSFTVAGGVLTENFTMTPEVYTVTFDETNALAGVGIQVYSDSGLTMPIGTLLTTDTSGEANIEMTDGIYYYEATMTGYNDYNIDSFKVVGADLTEYFTMVPASYSVTLDETNALAGVGIQVYSDSGLVTPIGTLLTTDTSGEATIELTDGTYYYEATKTGYEDYNTDSFTVAGGALTENFTMVLSTPVDFNVTFAEANSLSGVDIHLYKNHLNRSAIMEPLITDASGQANVTLTYDSANAVNNIYYYRAHKEGCDEWGGVFLVSIDPMTIDFEMMTTTDAIFAQDFTGVAYGGLPSGWFTDNPDLIYVMDNINTAWGNNVSELFIDYGPESIETQYRVSTPVIDCTTATSLTLSFDQYITHFSDVKPYTLKVQVSVDGGINWADVKTYTPNSANTNAKLEIGPETVRFDLSAFAGETINIAWCVEGYTYYLNGWAIDDIYLTGTGGANLQQ